MSTAYLLKISVAPNKVWQKIDLSDRLNSANSRILFKEPQAEVRLIYPTITTMML
jgi:hypothetical protein